MVGLGRLELPTSLLSGMRSNQLSYKPTSLTSQISGGAKQDRTADLLRARQALYQLSYSPIMYLSLTFTLLSYNKTICVNTQRSKVRRNSKEVIQPQVPLGLPCYDFTPVMNHKVVTVLPKVRLATSFATHSHGVTGGVYKARERIHRSILIYDY